MNPPISAIEQAAIFTLQAALLLLVFAYSLRYLFRTGRFRGAVLRMWGGLIAWSLCICVVMPLSITLITGDSRAFFVYPEPPAVVLITFTGWIHSLVICFIARILRSLWIRTFPPAAQDINA